MAVPVAAARIAVVVPSYRRPADLARCLDALAAQTRPADQLVVVARFNDHETLAVAAARSPRERPFDIVTTGDNGGVVAALNAGLDAVDADVVAFTDDDAAPRPDWLMRIEGHFARDGGLGGIGGRDWIFQHGAFEDGEEAVVGRLSWFGLCVGNHHLGVGPPREVDMLKGVNMAFRTRALDGVRFDTRLRGGGAQVCNELGVSLAVKRNGWKLVYDPSVAVDHYPSVRHDEDRRNTFCAEAVGNAAFNETLLLCEHLGPLRRSVFVLWALSIGHRAAPGFLQWCRLVARRSEHATQRFTATLRGRWSALKAAS
jgi:GT2 family glycosyltransferase